MMENKMLQDRKYEFLEGVVRNRASLEVIPFDEPVFVFRARDRHALEAIEHYACQVPNNEHRAAIEVRIADFARFAEKHPERMKEPDTDTSNGF